MVKNLPAVQETRVQSLDREDPLEEGMVTHSSILAKDREAWRATIHGITNSWTPWEVRLQIWGARLDLALAASSPITRRS